LTIESQFGHLISSKINSQNVRRLDFGLAFRTNAVQACAHRLQGDLLSGRHRSGKKAAAAQNAMTLHCAGK